VYRSALAFGGEACAGAEITKRLSSSSAADLDKISLPSRQRT
jgi:hypothetical protein